MPAKWIPADADDLVRRYVAGASEKALSDEFGVARNVIRRVLGEHGVTPRGRSEAELVKWSRLKTDRAAVVRQCSGAWRASIGIVRTDETRAKFAMTSFVRASKLVGAHEDSVIAICAGAGLGPVAQMAIGPYNIDVACEESRIAIEISGSPIVHAARDRLRERTKYLLDRGWCVLFVYVGRLWKGRRVAFDRAFVAEQIITLANRARRAEPVHGRYRVIRGDGKTTAMLRSELYDLPVV